MKTIVATNGKWILAGIVLVAVAALVVTGLGRQRGTRFYRWRVGLWIVALGLMGGVVGCKAEPPVVPVEESREKEVAKTEHNRPPVMCYSPIRPNRREVFRPSSGLTRPILGPNSNATQGGKGLAALKEDPTVEGSLSDEPAAPDSTTCDMTLPDKSLSKCPSINRNPRPRAGLRPS